MCLCVYKIGCGRLVCMFCGFVFYFLWYYLGEKLFFYKVVYGCYFGICCVVVYEDIWFVVVVMKIVVDDDLK